MFVSLSQSFRERQLLFCYPAPPPPAIPPVVAVTSMVLSTRPRPAELPAQPADAAPSQRQHQVFAYGTLQSAQVLRAIAGRKLGSEPAVLKHHMSFRVAGEVFPGAIARRLGTLAGCLYSGIDDATLALLDEYETTAYQRVKVWVECAAGKRRAWVYLFRDSARRSLTSEAWDYATFERDHEARFVAELTRSAP